MKFEHLYEYFTIIDTFERLKKGEYSVTHNLITRNRSLAVPKFHRLLKTQQSLSFAGPTLWNNLPPEIRNITSLARLKSTLRDHFVSQYRSWSKYLDSWSICIVCTLLLTIAFFYCFFFIQTCDWHWNLLPCRWMNYLKSIYVYILYSFANLFWKMKLMSISTSIELFFLLDI